MDYKVRYTAIGEMKDAGDIEGLFGMLESKDQYARKMATQALCSFCNPMIVDTLGQLKFTDVDQQVREVAARGHERMVAALRAKGEL
jgi:hypothetical protein